MAIYDCETQEQYVAEMQALINSGAVWKLEGSMGCSAVALINSGDCILGEQGHYDYYGNYEPGNIRFVTHKENCQNR